MYKVTSYPMPLFSSTCLWGSKRYWLSCTRSKRIIGLTISFTTTLRFHFDLLYWVHVHAVAFRIYDINKNGAIEPPELKRFLVAVMTENTDVHLDEAALDAIVEETFKESDLSKDGRINPEEWLALVQRNPSVISYMTLPVLLEISQKFPHSPEKKKA